MTRFRRFRTLQWQLTASYTAVSLLILIVLFVGSSVGFLFFEVASGTRGTQIMQKMDDALATIVVADDASRDQIATQLFEKVMVNCQLPQNSNGGFKVFDLVDPTNVQPCLNRNDIYVGFETEPDRFDIFNDLERLVIWLPEEDALVVSRAGRRTETYSLDAREDMLVQSALNGTSSYMLRGMNTLVAAPVFAEGGENGRSPVAAVLLVEMAFNFSSLFRDASLSDFLLPIGALGLFALIVGGIGSYVVTRRVSKRIETLEQLSDEWASGNFGARSKDGSPDEIGRLGRQLNQMVAQLESLLEARTQLTAVEERNRIARDLHDTAKQQLFAADMQLYAAENLLDKDGQQARTHLAEARQLTQTIRAELTTLIDALRPAQLDGKGLFEAVRETAVLFQQRNNIEVTVQTSGEKELPLPVEQTLFRVLQEALSNVARHSQATEATLRLAAEKEQITLQIQDNGIGFAPAKTKTGIGLSSINERLTELGGTATIHTNPTNGTTITATLPLITQPPSYPTTQLTNHPTNGNVS